MTAHTVSAARLLDACAAVGWTLGTVESCTGGLIAGQLTAIPGSSAVLQGGLVTYSNALKTRLAGVPASLIERHGAVSEAVACAMAEGGRRALGVDCCLSVTGIAGPGGATEGKPVGLVHLAAAGPGGTRHRRAVFPGDRNAVRLASLQAALALGLELLGRA